MKIMKVLAVVSMVSLWALSMVVCQKNEPEINVQTDIQGTGIGEYKVDVEVTPVAPTIPQTPQRTVIENGEVKVWAEHYDKDENIKPIRYEVIEGLSTPGHSLFYEVEGHTIEVAVNEKSGDRYFYEDGSTVNFAVIAENVKKSNEAVLNSYAANMRLNEEMKKKYE